MKILALGADGYLGWPTCMHLASLGFDGETCNHGHVGEYTEVKSGEQAGMRYCKDCRRDRAKEAYWLKKDATG